MAGVKRPGLQQGRQGSLLARKFAKRESFMSLAGKTLFITGASRGIGLAIALRAARDGANIAIAAKTAAPHPKLPGTIYSAAVEIEEAGGQALALTVDVRDEASVAEAVEKTVAQFGGVDICVNNASAISLTGTLATEMKRYDLMHQVNARGAFLVSKACLPHLKQAANPHVLMLSPPLDMSPRWFGGHVAYTMAKYGMSMCVLGMAEEFKGEGVAFNALWPRTAIATAAVEFALAGADAMGHCRKVEIMADAAYAIFNRPARGCSGNFFIDDVLLYEEGVRDFDQYRVDPTKALMPDFFVPENTPTPPGVSMGAKV
jgi:citronellol/citronellal dehydrogenase